MIQYEPVIGLEVHCQLSTQTKLFCGCSTQFGAPANSQTCPVCLGMPGVLPVMNREVLRLALRIGAALNCSINQKSRFARKNYFYPDLPKGYQISQFDQPLLEGGAVEFDMDDGLHRVDLTRIHLEEDAGKSIHLDGENASCVDVNRCGIPLIEIVSEPQIRSAEEAASYLRELRNIVRYLGISDGHMEQGSFRCDANVSIRPAGQETLGTRTELKNLNSFNYVKKAIDYEIARQTDVLDAGEAITQETRLWDERAGCTRSMRSKEEAHDYRYFPDPDLLTLVVPNNLLDDVRSTMPELPRQRRERYQQDYGVSQYDAAVLTSEKELSTYYEAVVGSGADAKMAANWVQGELRGRLNADNTSIDQSPVSPDDLGKILARVADGRLSGKLAKQVFSKVYAGGSLQSVLDETGEQVSDIGAIEAVIDDVFSRHANEVESYLNGKHKLMGFFVGQVMKSTGGKANPKIVSDVLKQKLEAMGP